MEIERLLIIQEKGLIKCVKESRRISTGKIQQNIRLGQEEVTEVTGKRIQIVFCFFYRRASL